MEIHINKSRVEDQEKCVDLTIFTVPQENLLPDVVVPPRFGMACLAGWQLDLNLQNPAARVRLQIALFYDLGCPPRCDFDPDQKPVFDGQSFPLDPSRLSYRVGILNATSDQPGDGYSNSSFSPLCLVFFQGAGHSPDLTQHTFETVSSDLEGIFLSLSSSPHPRITVSLFQESPSSSSSSPNPVLLGTPVVASIRST